MIPSPPRSKPPRSRPPSPRPPRGTPAGARDLAACDDASANPQLFSNSIDAHAGFFRRPVLRRIS